MLYIDYLRATTTYYRLLKKHNTVGRLVGSVGRAEHATLDHGIVSSSPTQGMELTWGGGEA